MHQKVKLVSFAFVFCFACAAASGFSDAAAQDSTGKWTGEYSETVLLKPQMSAFEFVNAFKNVEIPNAAGSLLNVNAVLVDQTAWKDGFQWAQGDQSIEVKGERDCAGIKGLLASCTSNTFGRVQKRTYCVNSRVPLPLHAEVPAADDTWTYE
jgi:hypothetical protein